MKPIYCADSYERIPPEYFTQAKAVFCDGKPYLTTSARRLGLLPDPAPPPEYAWLVPALPRVTKPAPAPAPAAPPGMVYCTKTLERIPPEYFAQGKAVWHEGKPYLVSALDEPAPAPAAQPATPANCGAGLRPAPDEQAGRSSTEAHSKSRLHHTKPAPLRAEKPDSPMKEAPALPSPARGEAGTTAPIQQVAKRRWLRRLAWSTGLAAAFVLLGLCGALLYFNDAYFKNLLKAEIKSRLGRDCDATRLHVSFWNGDVTLDEFKLLNADETCKEREGLRVRRVHAALAPWTLLYSGFRKVQALQVEIQEPEVLVERRLENGRAVTNFDDVLARLAAGPPARWPRETGLQAFALKLNLQKGAVVFRDGASKAGAAGESRIERLDVTVAQSALGQPAVANARFVLCTPGGPEAGSGALYAKLNWLDAAGRVDPAACSGFSCSLALNDLDLAHLARLAGLEGALAGGKYAWTLGQPFSGSLKAEAATPADLRIVADLRTAGLLSISEAGRPLAGSPAASLSAELKTGWQNGAWRDGPLRGRWLLAATPADLGDPAARKFLDLEFEGASAAGGVIVARFQSALRELLATPLGRVLGLQERLGGQAAGKFTAQALSGGGCRLSGEAALKDGFLLTGTAKQPLDFTLTGSGTLASGVAECAFTARAASVEFESVRPARLTWTGDPVLDATLRCHVRGREFWKEWAPLLAQVNLNAPLEEALDGELTLAGGPAGLHFALDGTLRRQADEPSPVALQVSGDGDPRAVGVAGKPCLGLRVRVASERPATDIRMSVSLVQTAGEQVVDVTEFRNQGELSALNALNARFGAYARLFLGPRYTVSGAIDQSGSSRLTRSLGPDGAVVATRLALATEINLRQPEIQGPPLVHDGPPLQWKEDVIHLQLALEVFDEPAGSTLKLNALDFRSGTLSVSGKMEAGDLAKLKKAATTGPGAMRLWAEALPKAELKATISGDALARLQRLHVFEEDPLVIGDLELDARYDGGTQRAEIPALAFKGAALEAQLSASGVDAPTVGALLDRGERSLSQWVQALPRITVVAEAHPPLLRRLQLWGGCPVERSTVGHLKLMGSYDPATRRAVVEDLSLHSDNLSVRLAASNLDLPVLAALADERPVPWVKWVEALPELAVETQAGEAAVRRLQASTFWLREPLTVGGLNFKGFFAAKTRRAHLESLVFTGPALRVKASASDFDVPRLAALLETPGPRFSKWLPVLPAMRLEISASDAALARLQELRILPEDAALRGEAEAAGTFDPASRQWKLDRFRFVNAALEADVTAPAIELERVAAFAETAGGSPGAALPMLGDFSFELKGRPPLFEALRARKVLPDDPVIAGTLDLKARYVRAEDRLRIESARFKRAEPGNVPVTELTLSGELAEASRRLSETPLRALGLLGGFDHGLRIESAVADPAALCALLERQGAGGAWLEDIRSGVYRIGAPRLEGLVLKPVEPGVFDLAFQARVAAGWHPRPAPEQPPAEAAAAELNGLLAVAEAAPLRVDLRGAAPKARGTILLDTALLNLPNPVYPYRKPAGMPCRISFQTEGGAEGELRLNALELSGGPLNAALENLTWYTRAERPKFSLDKLVLRDGPLPCTLSALALDAGTGQVRFGVAVPNLDARAVAARLGLPPGLAVSGGFGPIQGSFAGSLSAFAAGPGPQDQYTLRIQTKDLRLAAASGAAALTVNGLVELAPARLLSLGLGLALDSTPAGAPPRNQRLNVGLEAVPREQGATLAKALSEPGLPAILRVGLRSEGPLDMQVLVEGLRALADAGTAAGPAGAPRAAPAEGASEGDGMGKLARIRLEASMAAPELRYDDLVLQNVQAGLLVLDEMKLGIQNARAAALGGEIEIVQALYDLTAQPLAHWQTVSFSNVSLAALMGTEGKPPVDDQYQVSGRLSGSGTLAGRGFRRGDRRNWQATANVSVSDLLALKNGGKEGGTDIGKALIGGFGSLIGGGLGRAARFYSADFGLFLNRLEFEPATVQTQVDQGKARVFPALMTGKGRAAGLQFGLGGDIDLVSLKFDPKFFVWPTRLPESSQRAMGLYELDAAERQQILNYMAQGAYYLIYTGKVTDPKMDDQVFVDLLGYIDRRVQARQAQQPNLQNQPPQANFNDILQLFQSKPQAPPAQPAGMGRDAAPKKKKAAK